MYLSYLFFYFSPEFLSALYIIRVRSELFDEFEQFFILFLFSERFNVGLYINLFFDFILNQILFLWCLSFFNFHFNFLLKFIFLFKLYFIIWDLFRFFDVGLFWLLLLLISVESVILFIFFLIVLFLLFVFVVL